MEKFRNHFSRFFFHPFPLSLSLLLLSKAVDICDESSPFGVCDSIRMMNHHSTVRTSSEIGRNQGEIAHFFFCRFVCCCVESFPAELFTSITITSAITRVSFTSDTYTIGTLSHALAWRRISTQLDLIHNLIYRNSLSLTQHFHSISNFDSLRFNGKWNHHITHSRPFKHSLYYTQQQHHLYPKSLSSSSLTIVEGIGRMRTC